MNRMRTCSALVLALAFSPVPLIAQADTGAPAPPKQTHQMPAPKNLQVLPRDISGPDLIALMRGYSKALGVECSFCHERNAQTGHPDFASDAKPDKTIARTMITMTNEINAKYLATVKDPDATPADKTVTCGTCHRGNTMPTPFEGAGPEEHHDMPAKAQ